MTDRYGNAKITTLRRDLNELRTAVRSEGTDRVQNAWDNCERWLDRAFVPAGSGWQPIETAPKGVERNGKKAMSWMMLAIPDDEDGFHTLNGMRVGDDFFAAHTFYCGGPFDGKQFRLKETQVHPTHWQPLPPPPTEDS